MNLQYSEVRGMSLWAFYNHARGWRLANCPSEGPRAPTKEQFEAADWNF